MTNEKVSSRLQCLLGTLEDGRKGFSEAAQTASSDRLREFLNECSEQRASMASEVESQIKELGSQPKPDSIRNEHGYHAWSDVHSYISGKDDYAVASEAEHGEDIAITNYKNVLRDAELPNNVRSLVEKQFERVQASHKQIMDIRQSIQPR